MAEISSGTALRELQRAQAQMKKARGLLRDLRGGTGSSDRVFAFGWQSLADTSRVLAGIPLSAATDEVLTRQLAVQRYATALLVRLRRLLRKEPLTGDDADLDDDLD